MKMLYGIVIATLFFSCSNILNLDSYNSDPPVVDSPVKPSSSSNPAEPDAPDEGPARPPSPPPGLAAASGTGATLALAAKAFYFGIHDPTTGARDLTRSLWRDYGYDLDGICTDAETIQAVGPKSSGGTCIFEQSVDSARSALRDGNRCRDNVFASQIGEILAGFNGNFQSDTNRDIIIGSQTLVLVLEDIDSYENDPYVPAKAYVTTQNLSGGFLWNGSDVREIDSSTVTGDDLQTPKQSFPYGYISKGVWVNGPFNETPFNLPLLLNKNIVTLPTLSTTIGIAFDPATKDPISSTLASAVSVDELVSTLRTLAERSFSCALLKMGALDAYLATVRTNVDLVNGEPNFTNAASACNTISLGIKLQWSPILVPTRVEPVKPVSPACKVLPASQ